MDKRVKKFVIEDKVFRTSVLFIMNADKDTFMKVIRRYGVDLKKYR